MSGSELSWTSESLGYDWDDASDSDWEMERDSTCATDDSTTDEEDGSSHGS